MEESHARAGATEATGSSGQSYVEAVFRELGWAVAANPMHDLGTDLWISPRDVRRFDLGLMLGVQVKNGPHCFSRPTTQEKARGWWHYDTQKHFKYWSNHNIPHILILRNPTTHQAYWVHVNREKIEWTESNGKVFVPEEQVLNADALPALIDIAAATRPAPRWAGSAWTGARDLAPVDVLRHALLAPRLVAPHPNIKNRVLQAPEAIALLTSGRFRELHRYDLLKEDHNRVGWAWDLFSALLAFVTAGKVDALRVCCAKAA